MKSLPPISPELTPDAPARATPALGAGLYILATPIGNLADVTLRVLRTLPQLSALACEDTRTTQTLLRAHGIRVAELLAYHEHNADQMRPKILARVAAGESIGLVSDAGTPLISDPGYRLVDEARALGLPVIPMPGASALLTALAGAGLPTDQFHFAGFLPSKSGARMQSLQALAAVPGTLVFYESPRRVGESLAAMREALGGDRAACVARELTKMFEEFRRGTLAELAAAYADVEVKGEVVILVGPAPARAAEFTPDAALTAFARAAMQGGMPLGAVADALATLTGQNRKILYQWLLSCKDNA